LKLGSLFSGSGTCELAAVLCGIEPVFASEIEKFPIQVTSKRFPNMKHLGDITQINGAEIEPVDIITFGSPCFPAGTMILTEKGYAPIEDIKIGDMVLTHKNRWRKVTDFGWKMAETYKLKGNITIETTAEHPIYSAEVKKYSPYLEDGKRGNIKTIVNSGQWTEAKDMGGKQWATPFMFENLPVPEASQREGRQKSMPEMNVDFWYFVGRWLGDGWVRDEKRANRPDGQRNGQIFICGSLDEEFEVAKTVSKVSDYYSVGKEKTSARVRFGSQLLCGWLTENFGRGAINKTIPSWVISLPIEYRRSLLLGITESDGHQVNDGTKKITTISKKMVLGLRFLCESLGYTTSISHYIRPKTTVIEGRTVNQKDTYTIAICNSGVRRTGIECNDHKWYKCRNVVKTGEIKRVYNISVEEDESYIADSIVVHNCQDLSVAGKRAGLEGSRSNLFMDAIRIIEEMREATDGKYPRYAVWENVPGAFSSNKGHDFRAVLEAFAKTEIPMPDGGRWAKAGMVELPGRQIAWRVLDSQYFGVPQRRKRIFLVCDFNGKRASEILFKPESMFGDYTQSGEARERVAENFEGCANGAGGAKCLNPWDSQSARIYSEDGVWHSLNANTNGGQSRDAVLTDKNEVGVIVEYPENSVGSLVARADGSPCVDRGQPFIVTAGFMAGQGAKAGSIGYCEEVSPTLKSVNSGGNTVPSIVTHVTYPQVTGTLCASGAGLSRPAGQCNEADLCIVQTKAIQQNASGEVRESDTAYTISTNSNPSGRNSPLVYSFDSKSSNPQDQIIDFTNRGMETNDVADTLQSESHGAIPMVAFACNQRDEIRDLQDCAGALQAQPGMKQQTFISEQVAGVDCRKGTENEDLSATLQAKPGGGFSLNCTHPVRIGNTTRRLTPTECARLQGFPDFWCADIPHSDTAEYKMWGNGMTLNVVLYIMQNIADVLIADGGKPICDWRKFLSLPENVDIISQRENVTGSGFTPTGFAKYEEGIGTLKASLKASGGDLGGGSESIIVSIQQNQ